MENGKIALCKSNCKTELDFWKSVSALMDALTTQDYTVLFRYEDCDVYILEFAHDATHTDYGEDRYILVTPEEEEQILFQREDKGGESEE